MAKFIGDAGDFQEDRAIKRRVRLLISLYVVSCIAVFIAGYLAASRNVWFSLIAIAVAVPLYRQWRRSIDQQFRRIQSDEKGAAGEREVGRYLKELPDDFVVVQDFDFRDSYGNIDHVVFGPTGVFALDVKNWKGTVSPDGKGELLHNGHPTDKPQVRQFTRRVMELKDRLNALIKLDPYVQCVFVFPQTQIEAKWGSTGPVHCVHAEKLAEYITTYHPQRPLTSGNMRELAASMEALKKLAMQSIR